ncbi:unnamed protein product [Cyprideis torosa]|uniref:Uncharacterized protein n=1 Tax=Cyprideis torosa TaxID=163714 RepID=A0A7R8WES4_9CRUS|nr:unnamed protein product [Cyprideis torosa]CAG0890120.1 unnamed protein product [Cyprideis torosa]
MEGNSKRDFRSLVFFDLETTGCRFKDFHPRVRITELSLVAVESRHFIQKSEEQEGELPRVINKLTLCFNPQRFIQTEAIGISNLTNHSLDEQSPMSETSLACFNSFLAHLPRPICLIAHNGRRFDFPILRSEMRKFQMELPGDVFCTDSWEATTELLPTLKEEQELYKCFMQESVNERNDVEAISVAPQTPPSVSRRRLPFDEPGGGDEQRVPQGPSTPPAVEQLQCTSVLPQSPSPPPTLPINEDVPSRQDLLDCYSEELKRTPDKIWANGKRQMELSDSEKARKKKYKEDQACVDVATSPVNVPNPPSPVVSKGGPLTPSKVRPPLRQLIQAQRTPPPSKEAAKTRKYNREGSYKLETLHVRFFNAPPTNAHRAEDDCISLLRVTRCFAAQFLEWMSQNHFTLKDVELAW